jgi:hypothetical protein
MIRKIYQGEKYVLIFILSIFQLHVYGQQQKIQEQSSEFYSTNFNQNLNGLVLNRTVISGQYQKERRTFELGILMNEFKNVSGFVFKHKYFLNKSKNSEDYNPEFYPLRPYLFYRFVYNSQMPSNFLSKPVTNGGIVFQLNENSIHTINTIEHYLGMGLELDILDNIFVHTAASIGFYFFKDNMKATRINDQLVPKATTGFAFNISTGIGYRF